MKILNKMQRRAAIWVLGAFKTSPTEGIEALAGLMPIRFHLQKIAKRSLIRPFKLPANYILNNLMNRPVRNSSNLGNSVCTMRLLFHRCLPKLSSKGVLPVAMCFCHYTGILQQLAIPSNYLVGS